jgi:hypothetical protein
VLYIFPWSYKKVSSWHPASTFHCLLLTYSSQSYQNSSPFIPPNVNIKIPPYRSPLSASINILPKCSQLLYISPLLPTQKYPLPTTVISSLPNSSLCLQRIPLNEGRAGRPTKFRTKKICISSLFPFLRFLRVYKCFQLRSISCFIVLFVAKKLTLSKIDMKVGNTDKIFIR